jgi:Protein of unknown function (DUF2591)
MKIKVSEATGPVLDWMVAKAEGYDEGWLTRQMGNPNPHTRAIPAFSTDWSQGGPIIERDLLCLDAGDGSYAPQRKWAAWYSFDAPVKAGQELWGLTPLIAAMRCFVASKLGDEVDVPEELL